VGIKKGATLTVHVANNAFTGAELTGVEITADITLDGTAIKLKGEVSGSINADYQVTFDGAISLENDIEKKFGDAVTVGIKKGATLTVHVANNAFTGAELTGVEITVDVKVGDQTVKLKGSVEGDIDEAYLVSFVGSIALQSKFTQKFGDAVTVSIASGASLTITVEKNAFKSAELKGVEIDVSVKIGDDTLNLHGSVEGKIDENYDVDIKGSISLVGDWIYTFPNGKATVKDGATLTVCVEKSAFKYAELTSVEIDVEVTVGGKKIELGGTITKGRYENGKIDFEGSIELKNDFEYKLDPVTAVLKKGGSLKVVVEQSEFQYAEITNVTATIDIKLGDKEIKLEGSITKGKYDKAGKVDLEASISLVSPVVLFDLNNFKATLSSATVGVKVVQSALTEMTAEGRADLAVTGIAGADISGYLQVKWTYTGGDSKFSGKGKLTVSMLEGKLTGEIDAELFEDGKWDIKGTLTYKMNEFITGEIGVEMDQDLDPTLNGKITVEGVELIPGRDLFNMSVPIIPWISTTVVVVVVPITLGFGVDFGFKVSLLPVTFGAEIEITNFKPLHEAMPDFSVMASLSTGLNVGLALEPYATLGIGVGGILEAGFKLKGGIHIDAPITVEPYLKLESKGGKFSGELGFKVNVSIGASLTAEGTVYAAALGQMIEWGPDFLKGSWDLGELFSYDWEAAYKFGDSGNETTGPSQGSGGGVDSAPEPASEMAEESSVGSEFGDAKKASDSAPGPVVDEESTKADEPDGGPMAEFKEKMDEAMEWAEHLGNFANFVGFVVSAVTLGLLLSFLGPIGFLIAAVIGILLAGGPSKIMDGINSMFWLIGKGAAIIGGLLPDWVGEIMEVIEGGADYAAGKLYEWGAGNLGEWWPVFEPIFGFLKGKAEEFTMAFQKMDGSVDGLIEGLVDLIVSASGSLLEVCEAFGGCLSELCKLVVKLTYDGRIVATCLDPDDWGKNPWKWSCEIPGVITASGQGDDLVNWGIGNGLSYLLKNTFGASPNTNTSSEYGFDY
jgi:hypothetical protein